MILFIGFIAVGIVLMCLFTFIGQAGIRIFSRSVRGSGKPRQHFNQKNSRKEAARSQGDRRSSIHHNERGKKSHFHPSDKNGNIHKDGKKKNH
ncbi:unnamed protein product [Adineta steineri]|uniref:Uncharacterized protein n=1 Tax=Adineta steineri TaxID=433720 RepID=A0A818SLQ8_9BILA|nr:unnamed protein product [Adineta steineri]CAF0853930.1 unnamed protein product [Adineta steineri]CAF3667584.1 unnamed protein product [Adineta steineri]CAF3695799.1 unnamed protein product [Adineta steineri]